MPHRDDIIVPFEMIYFLEFGLLKIIYDKYNNDKYFNFDIMQNSDKRIIYNLLNRNMENPISLIIKDEYKHLIDTFRDQFMENEYSDIVKLSPKTGIYNLIITGKKIYNLLGAGVICKNELEKQIINNDINMKGVNILDDYTSKDYNILFFHDINNVLHKIRYISGKNVIVSNVRYNLQEYGDKFSIPEEIEVLTSDLCRLSLIDIFNITQEYLING